MAFPRLVFGQDSGKKEAPPQEPGLAPVIFGDHMVLQRHMEVPIWGMTDPGGSVSVTFMGRTKTAKADDRGKWMVKLDKMEAVSQPQEMTVKDAKRTKVFKDVLVGEVWLCAGQSNMEMPVQDAEDFSKEAAQATDSQIRHFKVRFRPLWNPDPTLDGPFRPDPITKAPTGRWFNCSPKTVGQFSAAGYFMARRLRKELDVPIGLINATWGGTTIEAWTPPGYLIEGGEGPAGAEPARPPQKEKPNALYNGMIHPLVGYGMRGMAWYQGESSRRDGMRYVAKMKRLVDSLRLLWGIGDFPVYFVQIAPLNNKPSEEPDLLPKFWVAQSAAAATIPNTGMAVITDISGDPKEIHPKNKQDVGSRLALLALNRTYGRKDIECSGATFREAVVEGSHIRVKFDHAAGLKSRNGQPLDWFEVRGESGAWAKAEAKIDGDTVLVSAPGVDKPRWVRFAWGRVAQPNLSNGAGLPTPAFNTSPDFPSAEGGRKNKP